MASTPKIISGDFLYVKRTPANLKEMGKEEFEIFISNGFTCLLMTNIKRLLWLNAQEAEAIRKQSLSCLEDLSKRGFINCPKLDNYKFENVYFGGRAIWEFEYEEAQNFNISTTNLKPFEIMIDGIQRRDKESKKEIHDQFIRSFIALKDFYYEKYNQNKEMDLFLESTHNKNAFIFELAGMRTYNLESFNRVLRRHKNKPRTNMKQFQSILSAPGQSSKTNHH